MQAVTTVGASLDSNSWSGKLFAVNRPAGAPEAMPPRETPYVSS
jgi:hypothetical protein